MLQEQIHDGTAQPDVIMAAWKSDGEIAIESAALLSQQVRRLLWSALEDRRSKPIRDLVRGPQARVLAYCLGLLSEEEFSDLSLIHRIRNLFAHQVPRPTFDSPEIADRCRALITYRADRGNRASFERAAWRLMARMGRRA